MEEKRALNFAAGAKEVWICEPMGRCAFLISGEKIAHSHLIPEFPKVISIRCFSRQSSLGAACAM